jgi:Fe-S-cluster containining protein
MTRLPVIDGGESCFTCDAPCCTSYVVPLSGFDVWRLVRGLQLPFTEVAEARDERAVGDGFAVDGSERRLGFFLRTREAEVCRFLLTLPSGKQRCGIHGSRPMACRIYPWKPTENSQLGVEMISHALCPPPQRARFASQMREARGEIQTELAERPLYAFVVARWNEHVAMRPSSVENFVAWMLRLYDALEPLRRGVDAQRLISEFPLD